MVTQKGLPWAFSCIAFGLFFIMMIRRIDTDNVRYWLCWTLLLTSMAITCFIFISHPLF